MQKEQLAKVEARKAAERQAEMAEGQEILDRSKAEIEEDRQKAWERKMWHRKNNEGTEAGHEHVFGLRFSLCVSPQFFLTPDFGFNCVDRCSHTSFLCLNVYPLQP